MSPGPAIAIDEVSKHFGMVVAVDRLSASILHGECIGLLGANGSGKTTLLRLLAGYFPPTRGEIRVAGWSGGSSSLARRSRIGYLPENFTVYPEMRVRPFLAWCARLHRVPAARVASRVETVLADCGLDGVANRLMGNLSKGYRQRVGIAQALLHEPSVLLLDEPTAGLDPHQLRSFRSLLQGLRGRSTVILSTHILQEVGLLCDRVLVMHRGRLVADDPAADLAQRAGGEDRCLVRVTAPFDAVEDVLRSIPGVDGLERVDTAGGQAAFLVAVRDREITRAAIAATMVERGWALLELRAVPLSLEDLYVRLTSS